MPAKKPLDPLPLTPTTTTSQQATSLPPEWVDADTTPPPEVLEQPVLPGKQITTWTATPEPHVHTKIGDAVQRVFEAINKIAYHISLANVRATTELMGKIDYSTRYR